MTQVSRATDTIKMNLQSFGFDKYQTQFLEHRVFNKQPEELRAIFDRVRFNIKTLGLNDNIDINVEIDSVNEEIVEHYTAMVGTQRSIDIGLDSSTTSMEDSSNTFYSCRQLVENINAVCFVDVKTTYTQLDDSERIVAEVDTKFMQKFLNDFILDMDQFEGVFWTMSSDSDKFGLHMTVPGIGIVLYIGFTYPK